jgi:isopenicillin N synthase-like dioxygenase
MDPKLKDAVMERIPQRSSISFIHYVPRDEPSKRADPSEVSSAIDEDGLNVPSKVHTDTGIMTFILCNDVPGLLVENRAKQNDDDAWFAVETMFSPYKYLFCILGNKTELFSLKAEFALKPTVHKVAIPYGVERHSLLYFVDVPQ